MVMIKIKIRGLVRTAGWLFFIWGVTVAAKGFFDIFFGEPEANYYSPHPWEFITRAQWHTWSVFEVMYGLACILITYAVWKYAAYVPEQVTKEEERNESF
ncbi:MAG: hypothetical protein NTU66_00350 [Elusimicrobia bacterium]|nr:hypothetical protein [Elusimicrobiota bacterium]